MKTAMFVPCGIEPAQMCADFVDFISSRSFIRKGDCTSRSVQETTFWPAKFCTEQQR